MGLGKVTVSYLSAQKGYNGFQGAVLNINVPAIFKCKMTIILFCWSAFGFVTIF